MTPHECFRRVHRRLHMAAYLVPRVNRAAWREEWIAELSYAARQSPMLAVALADGLVRDAIMVRRLHVARRIAAIDWEAPEACLRVLTFCFAVLSLASAAYPQVRNLVLSRWGVGAFFCFTVLAVLALPSTVVTSRFSACKAYSGDAATMAQRWSRWRFLAAKLVLSVLSCYLLAVHVTWLFQRLLGAQADWLLIACGLLFNVIAVSWAFTDQRQRCPTCMRSLSGAARLGPPSWSLLDSNATEEMCDRGHGLLHQPQWQTSWFEYARWLQLDSTWSELFKR